MLRPVCSCYHLPVAAISTPFPLVSSVTFDPGIETAFLYFTQDKGSIADFPQVYRLNPSTDIQQLHIFNLALLKE